MCQTQDVNRLWAALNVNAFDSASGASGANSANSANSANYGKGATADRANGGAHWRRDATQQSTEEELWLADTRNFTVCAGRRHSTASSRYKRLVLPPQQCAKCRMLYLQTSASWLEGALHRGRRWLGWEYLRVLWSLMQVLPLKKLLASAPVIIIIRTNH